MTYLVDKGWNSYIMLSGVLREGHWAMAPFGQKKINFSHWKNRKTWFGPFCESITDQTRNGPLYEILNTSLILLPPNWANSYLTRLPCHVLSKYQRLLTPNLCYSPRLFHAGAPDQILLTLNNLYTRLIKHWELFHHPNEFNSIQNLLQSFQIIYAKEQNNRKK